jgi:hypothetical protein
VTHFVSNVALLAQLVEHSAVTSHSSCNMQAPKGQRFETVMKRILFAFFALFSLFRAQNRSFCSIGLSDGTSGRVGKTSKTSKLVPVMNSFKTISSDSSHSTQLMKNLIFI